MKIENSLKNIEDRSLLVLIAFLILTSCANENDRYDASGAFEADETIISAEVPGVLKGFKVEEGQKIKEGMYLGLIDTTQLYLQKKQLKAQIQAILSRRPDINAQLLALRAKLKAAEIDQARIQKLYQAEAATEKQLDAVNAQVAIIKGNLSATYTSLNTNTTGLESEVAPLEAQLDLLNDQIKNCILEGPMDGTVLMTYTRMHEMVLPGKPLYKIADLSTITLKVYITGDQLPKVKLNQEVKVMTDDGNGGYLERNGTIFWISDEAEFTPKSIQTKDERADKVYAMKIRVPNDGTYKIGMYGQILI